MRLFLSCTLLLFLLSCVAPNNGIKSQNLNCVENQNFKNEFFKNVKIIDSLITENQNIQFKKSLKFISKYSHVSFESLANYSKNIL